MGEKHGGGMARITESEMGSEHPFKGNLKVFKGMQAENLILPIEGQIIEHREPETPTEVILRTVIPACY